MNFKPILFSQFIIVAQDLSENLQPQCDFLLYICPRPATFKGRGGDKNIKQPPSFRATKKFHKFLGKYKLLTFANNMLKYFSYSI